MIGSGGRTRTYDMAVNSRPLYRLSYAGAMIVATRTPRWLMIRGTRNGAARQNSTAWRKREARLAIGDA